MGGGGLYMDQGCSGRWWVVCGGGWCLVKFDGWRLCLVMFRWM